MQKNYLWFLCVCIYIHTFILAPVLFRVCGCLHINCVSLYEDFIILANNERINMYKSLYFYNEYLHMAKTQVFSEPYHWQNRPVFLKGKHAYWSIKLHWQEEEVNTHEYVKGLAYVNSFWCSSIMIHSTMNNRHKRVYLVCLKQDSIHLFL